MSEPSVLEGQADRINEMLEQKRQDAIRLDEKKRVWLRMMAMGFKPAPKRAYNATGANMVVALVKRDESMGGIKLVEDEIAGFGEVVSVGEGCHYKVGDVLMFSPAIGASIWLPGGYRNDDYRIVSEDEVYGAWPAELVNEREPRE